MKTTAILLADASQPPAGDGKGSGGGLGAFLPLILICVLGWFLLFRPMRRQENDRKQLIANLKKNDKVVAAGGIIGTVVLMKENEDEITLKVAENTRISVLRSSIVRVFREEETAKEPSKTE